MKLNDRQQEIQLLQQIYHGPDQWQKLYQHMLHCFEVLHSRVVVLLTLCSAVVSVTGFSGRLIAQTGAHAQYMVIAGLVLCLSAAATAACGVLPVYWISLIPGDDANLWLHAALQYRDRKSRAYRIALFTLLAGLTCYLTAMALMLLQPQAAPLLQSGR